MDLIMDDIIRAHEGGYRWENEGGCRCNIARL